MIPQEVNVLRMRRVNVVTAGNCNPDGPAVIPVAEGLVSCWGHTSLDFGLPKAMLESARMRNSWWIKVSLICENTKCFLQPRGGHMLVPTTRASDRELLSLARKYLHKYRRVVDSTDNGTEYFSSVARRGGACWQPSALPFPRYVPNLIPIITLLSYYTT